MVFRKPLLGLISASILAVPLMTAEPAHADGPSVRDRETARSLMAEGRTRRQKLDLEGSLQAFRAADTMLHFPTTGLEVARTEAMLGKLVEARESARRSLTEITDDNEPAFDRARGELRDLIVELTARIPTVLIHVEGDEKPVVELDGVTLDVATWEKPIELNPGRYSIVAVAGTRTARADVKLRESDHQDIPLVLARVPADVSSATPASTAERETQPRPASDSRGDGAGSPTNNFFRTTSPVILGGLGAAGLGTVLGVTAGSIALANKSAAQGYCVNNLCPPSSHGAIAEANTWATVSTVSFVAVGVGLATAATWYLTHRNSAADRLRAGTTASFVPGVWTF